MHRYIPVIAALVWSCGTTPASVPAEDLIGRPPPASEDPFFFVAMEKAIPVETSGRVEPMKPGVIEEAVDPKTQIRADKNREAALFEREQQVMTAERRIAQAETRLQESEEYNITMLKRRDEELNAREALVREDFERLGKERAELNALKLALERRTNEKSSALARVETTPPPEIRSGFQCMSCVAVCEVIDGKQVCPEREDLICGWGTHTDRNTASKLAEEECKGALKLTANMQTYGKIEGKCPPASCQK